MKNERDRMNGGRGRNLYKRFHRRVYSTIRDHLLNRCFWCWYAIVPPGFDAPGWTQRPRDISCPDRRVHTILYSALPALPRVDADKYW